MDLILWPSMLAAQAAGEEPIGRPHAGEPVACCLCGMPIHEGDPCSPFKPPKSFIDQAGLTATGEFLCGYCPLVFRRATPKGRPLGNALQKQNTLVTSDAIYPINRNEHIAWFLLDPPEPPFVACITTAKAQHVLWKASVTLDRRLVRIQAGDHAMLIRHEFLMRELLPAAERLGDVLSSLLGRKRNPHPFIRLDARNNIVGIGALHPRIFDAIGDSGDRRKDLDTVMSATNGEMWAMSFLARATRIEPERPQALFSAETQTISEEGE